MIDPDANPQAPADAPPIDAITLDLAIVAQLVTDVAEVVAFVRDYGPLLAELQDAMPTIRKAVEAAKTMAPMAEQMAKGGPSAILAMLAPRRPTPPAVS